MYGGEMKSCQISKYLTLRHQQTETSQPFAKDSFEEKEITINRFFDQLSESVEIML